MKTMKCKKLVVFALSIIATLMMFLGMMTAVDTPVYAEGTGIYISGAAARLSNVEDSSGIRFEMNLSVGEYNTLMGKVGSEEGKEYKSVQFGILLAPKHYDDKYALDTYAFGEGGADVKYAWATKDEQGNYTVYDEEENAGKYRIMNFYYDAMFENEYDSSLMSIYGSNVNILDENLTLEFTAVGYIKYVNQQDKVSYKYTSDIGKARSVAKVAAAFVNSGLEYDEAQETILKKYIGAAIDGETLTFVDVKDEIMLGGQTELKLNTALDVEFSIAEGESLSLDGNTATAESEGISVVTAKIGELFTATKKINVDFETLSLDFNTTDNLVKTSACLTVKQEDGTWVDSTFNAADGVLHTNCNSDKWDRCTLAYQLPSTIVVDRNDVIHVKYTGYLILYLNYGNVNGTLGEDYSVIPIIIFPTTSYASTYAFNFESTYYENGAGNVASGYNFAGIKISEVLDALKTEGANRVYGFDYNAESFEISSIGFSFLNTKVNATTFGKIDYVKIYKADQTSFGKDMGDGYTAIVDFDKSADEGMFMSGNGYNNEMFGGVDNGELNIAASKALGASWQEYQRYYHLPTPIDLSEGDFEIKIRLKVSAIKSARIRFYKKNGDAAQYAYGHSSSVVESVVQDGDYYIATITKNSFYNAIISEKDNIWDTDTDNVLYKIGFGCVLKSAGDFSIDYIAIKKTNG